MRLKNKYLLLIFLVAPSFGWGQYSHTAQLQKVAATGFYSITITPEMSAHLLTSLNDFRITDESGQQVPYVQQTAQQTTTASYLRKFRIIENSTGDTGTTHLVIENTAGNINFLLLVIRNAAVSRTAKISGSDNGKTWFAIAENMALQPQPVMEKDRYLFGLSFPTSSYKYLQLAIINGKNDPLNIVDAGELIATTNKKTMAYLENPPFTFKQNDSSDRYSYIKVSQQAPYHINRLSLQFAGPKFYKRQLDLLTAHGTYQFELSSDTILPFYLPTLQDNAFLIKIYNGDNPPLKLTSAQSAQEEKHVVAFLEAGKQYTLLLGDNKAPAPEYDLANFKNSIPANPPSVLATSVMAVDTTPHSNSRSAILWTIIAAVLLVLGWFTWRLTKEVSNKNI